MDHQTYVDFMKRMNQKKRDLELQFEEDEFEAQRYMTDWICGRMSLTIAQRIDLQQKIFQ
jgi:hypothetical protein